MTNYYQAFCKISNHLTTAQLLDKEQNTEFFMGFYPDDQEMLGN